MIKQCVTTLLVETMVVWYSPRKLCFLPPQRVSRYFTTLHHQPPHKSPVKLPLNNLKRNAPLSTKPPGGDLHTGNGEATKRWLGWRKVFQLWRPLPIGVGLALLAVLQWRHIRRRNQDQQFNSVPVIAKDWEITCYRAVPLRAMSRVWGWLTNKHVPTSMRPWLYSSYASAFGCNLEEAACEDLKSYKSLAEFFCRSLKDGCRPIDRKDCIVSPADGRILSCGPVRSCQVEQVKGVTYSLNAFLGPVNWCGKHLNGSVGRTDRNGYYKPRDVKLMNHKIEGSNSTKRVTNSQAGSPDYCKCLLENRDTVLYQCVIYLAPGDYHRFHSPVNWDVGFRRHFQGELLSVNPTVARWIPELFTLNERAVYVGRWKHGFFSLTAVGATNVGSIHVYCDDCLVTNERKWRGAEHKYRDTFLHRPDGSHLRMKKGQAFGEFRLGSTIVILFEAPRDYKFNLEPGQLIKVGEGISQCAN